MLRVPSQPCTRKSTVPCLAIMRDLDLDDKTDPIHAPMHRQLPIESGDEPHKMIRLSVPTNPLE